MKYFSFYHFSSYFYFSFISIKFISIKKVIDFFCVCVFSIRLLIYFKV